MKRKWLVTGMAVFILAWGALLYAQAPLDTIKGNINRVLEVVQDKSLDRNEKIAKIESLYSIMFDEVELAKRSLARNWTKLNPEQQKEFIGLFREILKNAYIDKILGYNNEKIDFTGENTLSESQAEVRTTVLSKGRKVPINYRLIRKNNAWKIYDVVIENVSLIQNYRSQFNSILANNTPEQMLETLRKRVKAKKS